MDRPVQLRQTQATRAKFPDQLVTRRARYPTVPPLAIVCVALIFVGAALGPKLHQVEYTRVSDARVERGTVFTAN